MSMAKGCAARLEYQMFCPVVSREVDTPASTV
jgi:hypothetical protein